MKWPARPGTLQILILLIPRTPPLYFAWWTQDPSQTASSPDPCWKVLFFCILYWYTNSIGFLVFFIDIQIVFVFVFFIDIQIWFPITNVIFFIWIALTSTPLKWYLYLALLTNQQDFLLQNWFRFGVTCWMVFSSSERCRRQMQLSAPWCN